MGFATQEEAIDVKEKKGGIDFQEEMKLTKEMEEQEMMSQSVMKREKSVSESTSTEVKHWKLYSTPRMET